LIQAAEQQRLVRKAEARGEALREDAAEQRPGVEPGRNAFFIKHRW
jgi:hypothetical protein